jgi:hypothetical protein
MICRSLLRLIAIPTIVVSREGSASEGRFSSGKGSSQGARNDSRQQGGGKMPEFC